MKKATAKKLFSIIFLTVFFSKMVIAVAPLIISHFDKKAVHAVIMQLEIEHSSKAGDVKETPTKECFTLSSFGFTALHATQLVLPSMISADHDKHVQAFHPPVATPPPNA